MITQTQIIDPIHWIVEHKELQVAFFIQSHRVDDVAVNSTLRLVSSKQFMAQFVDGIPIWPPPHARTVLAHFILTQPRHSAPRLCAESVGEAVAEIA